MAPVYLAFTATLYYRDLILLRNKVWLYKSAAQEASTQAAHSSRRVKPILFWASAHPTNILTYIYKNPFLFSTSRNRWMFLHNWLLFHLYIVGDIKFLGKTPSPVKSTPGPGELIPKRWALSGAIFPPPHSREIWPPVCYDFWYFFCFALSKSVKRPLLTK